MDKLFFGLVCEEICVMFFFIGDMCLGVGVVWSSVWGLVFYGVVFGGWCCVE